MKTFKLGGLTLGSGRSALYIQEAKTLFAKSATLTPTRKKLINDCLKSLKDKGYLARMVALQFYAAHDEAFELTDWIGNITPSKIGSPAFEIDRGFTSAAGAGINTGFNPVRDGKGIFVKNKYSWGYYCRTNSQVTNRDAGHVDAITGTTIRARQSTDTLGYLAYRNNATTATGTTGAQTDSRGLFVLDKSSDLRVDVDWNGVSVANNTIAGGDLVDNEMYLGFYNNNGAPGSATNRQYAVYFAGDSFTPIERGEIFVIIETYLHAIGAGFFLT